MSLVDPRYIVKLPKTKIQQQPQQKVNNVVVHEHINSFYYYIFIFGITCLVFFFLSQYEYCENTPTVPTVSRIIKQQQNKKKEPKTIYHASNQDQIDINYANF